MILGIQTEIGEISDVIKRKFAYKKEMDIVNLSEEIGDIMWYIACYDYIVSKSKQREYFSLELKQYVATNKSKFETFTENFMSIVCEINKQVTYMFYYSDSEEGNEDIFSLKLYESVVNLAALLNINLVNSMQKNIEKLKVRFPDKFSEDLAINRNTEKERKKMEE